MESDTALERVNFFTGQLLSVADLTVEQEYFLSKHRRHNRYLHGWGVVSGLKVSVPDSSGIVVEPGVAIDCAGNEILVCSQARLKIPRKSNAFFVVLQYTETGTSPVPMVSSLASATDEELVFTRIREGFNIDIANTDPSSGHRGKGTGTPGCGCPHPLCIAHIKKGLHGWKVELRGRRV